MLFESFHRIHHTIQWQNRPELRERAKVSISCHKHLPFILSHLELPTLKQEVFMLEGRTFHHLYSYPKVGSEPAGHCWHAGEQTVKNTIGKPHETKAKWKTNEDCKIESFQYVSCHRKRFQVDIVSMWPCHCYRNQGYRGGRALVLHLEAMSQLQSHSQDRS